MNAVDVVAALLGLVLVVLGAIQVVTGQDVIGRLRRLGRPLHQTPSFFRAFGATFAFVGAVLAVNSFQGPFGRTGHGLVVTFLGMGAIVAATWAYVLYAVSKRS